MLPLWKMRKNSNETFKRSFSVFCVLSIAMILICLSPVIHSNILSFEGWEKEVTNGGDGGKLIWVTSLKDSGPGTLRDALNQEGPRQIVFKVGGEIALDSTLFIRHPYVTIAGHTSPGQGICLVNYGIAIRNVHDVRIHHIRLHVGPESGKGCDGIGVYNAQRILIDHCSVLWATDEAISVNAGLTDQVVVQWCLIAESLRFSVHPKGEHGCGSIVGAGGRAVYRHCIWVNNNRRNPRLSNQEPGRLQYHQLDIFSNLIVNWGLYGTQVNNDSVKCNLVGNLYIPGPSRDSTHGAPIIIFGNSSSNYIRQNYIRDSSDEWVSAEDSIVFAGNAQSARVLKQAPYPPYNLSKMQPDDLYDVLLSSCGAILPNRDAEDDRVLQTILEGTGTMVDHPDQVRTGIHVESAVHLDRDGDGLPDVWEVEHGLDTDDAVDATLDQDNDGRSSLQEWVDDTDPFSPQPEFQARKSDQ